MRRWAAKVESRFDATRLVWRGRRPPRNLRIAPYVGHGSGSVAVVRGRVLDNPSPSRPREDEGAGAAIRRSLARFNTVELPGVPLQIRLGGVESQTQTDDEGYFDLRLETDLSTAVDGWIDGEVDLAGPYRGISTADTTGLRIRVPGPDAGFGVISDIDDTILHTGAQRLATVMWNTFTGSALTRVPLPGAAELYRGLAGTSRQNPVFYVSSSPWNLYGFLEGFLDHRRFPPGPLLLRDLLGGGQEHSHEAHKGDSIDEILALHPDLPFILIGDSGQDDPWIYAQVARRYRDRVLAVYIRNVGRRTQSDLTDLGVDQNQEIPFVMAADSLAMAEHAANLGLVEAATVDSVRQSMG